MTDFPYSHTEATRMLADGLRSASQERGISLREIGRRLRYKQPVVLSHMANGRVPIPLDKAPAIADEVGLPQSSFLLAVLNQRHPGVDWQLITGEEDPFARELGRTARKSLSALSSAHHRVLREAVRDSDPDERWLSIPEISAMKLVRELFPRVRIDGLSSSDRSTLRTCAELLKDQDD